MIVATNQFGWVERGYPKPLCILFFDTEGIQWVDADASEYAVLQHNGYYGKIWTTGIGTVTH